MHSRDGAAKVVLRPPGGGSGPEETDFGDLLYFRDAAVGLYEVRKQRYAARLGACMRPHLLLRHRVEPALVMLLQRRATRGGEWLPVRVEKEVIASDVVVPHTEAIAAIHPGALRQPPNLQNLALSRAAEWRAERKPVLRLIKIG